MSNKNDKSEKPSKDGNGGEPPDLSHLHPITKALVAEIPGPEESWTCLLYTSPSPRDRTRSRMPSSA